MTIEYAAATASVPVRPGDMPSTNVQDSKVRSETATGPAPATAREPISTAAADSSVTTGAGSRSPAVIAALIAPRSPPPAAPASSAAPAGRPALIVPAATSPPRPAAAHTLRSIAPTRSARRNPVAGSRWKEAICPGTSGR